MGILRIFLLPQFMQRKSKEFNLDTDSVSSLEMGWGHFASGPAPCSISCASLSLQDVQEDQPLALHHPTQGVLFRASRFLPLVDTLCYYTGTFIMVIISKSCGLSLAVLASR